MHRFASLIAGFFGMAISVAAGAADGLRSQQGLTTGQS
jgi:hypothetical protein